MAGTVVRASKHLGSGWMLLTAGAVILGVFNVMMNPDLIATANATDPGTSNCSGLYNVPTCDYTSQALICCPVSGGYAYSCVSENSNLPSCSCTVVSIGSPFSH